MGQRVRASTSPGELGVEADVALVVAAQGEVPGARPGQANLTQGMQDIQAQAPLVRGAESEGDIPVVVSFQFRRAGHVLLLSLGEPEGPRKLRRRALAA